MSGLRLSARVPKTASRAFASPGKAQGTTPSSSARALALAYYIEDALESGRVASASEAAAYLGVTRARVSQIMALLGLSARLQEQVLMGELVISGRGLRRCLGSPSWVTQVESHLEAPGRRGR